MDEYIKKDAVIDILHYNMDECCSAVIKDIEELPSADVAPVVHGMWEDCTDDAGYWKCSNCEEPWVLLEGTPAENKMHYCPNCGAKMDLED